MPDPNTSPPGYFRSLETLAVALNEAVAQIEAAGGDVSALPVGDPVRVAVEAAEAVPPDLRTYDPNYQVP